MAKKELNVTLFDPITCERKVVSTSRAAEILGVTKSTIGSMKCRRCIAKGLYVIDSATKGRELKPLIQIPDLENEAWKQITGSNTWVSSCGRYRTKQGIVYINTNYRGQAQLSIGVNGKFMNVSPQKYVAEMFMEPKPPGAIIVHKDGNKYNNRVENLMYGSQAIVNSQIAKRNVAIPVLQLDPITKEVVEDYSSMSEAAKAMFTTRDVICRDVARGCESVGYLWVKDIEFIR